MGTVDVAGGALISERYELLRPLGEGAAGAVWLALDRRLGVEVALKLLRGEVTGQAGVFEAFARESDLSARMLSPNVVKLLGGGLTEGGIPYIVYERLEGEDLASRLARVSRLPLGEMKTVILHVCRALARAHAVGVIHRDIKPENIFLTVDTSGRLLAKVLDFGVAERIEQSSSRDPNALVGTLAYMAPEVFLGERPPSPASDLYAVGVVAYECCTGRLPRPARDISDLVVALASGTVAPAASLRYEVSPELDEWLERALHREPDARFPSARGMAEGLQMAMLTIGDRDSERRLEVSMPPASSSLRFSADEARTSSGTYSMIPGRTPPDDDA